MCGCPIKVVQHTYIYISSMYAIQIDMRIATWVLEALGLWVWVWGVGLEIQGSGISLWGFGFRALALGITVRALEFTVREVSGFDVKL